MKLIKYPIFICCLLFYTLVDNGTAQEKLVSFYGYWAFGYAKISYDDASKYSNHPLKSLLANNTSAVYMDMFGFYWPIKDNIMLGGIINGVADEQTIYGNDIQINSSTISFSTLYYFSNNIDRGFFIRGDIGPSQVGHGGIFSFSEQSSWGIGALAGLGYGIYLSDKVSLIFSTSYSLNLINEKINTTFGLSIAGLFPIKLP